jgi:ribosome recycling factor
MTPNEIVSDTKDRLVLAVAHFQDELKKLRTGRAHPSMLDGIMVEAYGTPMPLNQVGNVTAPEAQLIQITPFDPGNIGAISSAIRDNQSLGLNPSDDGRVVRVPIPPLNTERRQQIAKQLKEKVEDTLVSLRQARHEAREKLAAAKKDKRIGEDEHKRTEKQIDDLLKERQAEIELLAKTREQEIMTL